MLIQYIAYHRRNGVQGCRWALRRREWSPPPFGIVPCALFEADISIPADPFEPHGLVKRDAGLVRHCDTTERRDKALSGQNIEQDSIKRAPDPAPLRLICHVNRGIRGPAIGMPRSVSAGISVSKQRAIVIRNKPWIGIACICHAPGNLRRIGRDLLKGCGPLFDMRAVNRRDESGVVRCCAANLQSVPRQVRFAFLAEGIDRLLAILVNIGHRLPAD